MKQEKNSNFVNIILHIAGLLLCIVPPVICTLSYFPIWYHAGAEKALAGGSVILIILAAIPLFKFLRSYLESPASYIVWLIIFILFFLLSKIAYEMTVISFVGFVSNLLGAICFNIAKRRRVTRDE